MNLDVDTAIWFLSSTQCSLYTAMRVLMKSRARLMFTSLYTMSITVFLSLLMFTERLARAASTADDAVSLLT